MFGLFKKPKTVVVPESVVYPRQLELESFFKENNTEELMRLYSEETLGGKYQIVDQMFESGNRSCILKMMSDYPDSYIPYLFAGSFQAGRARDIHAGRRSNDIEESEWDEIQHFSELAKQYLKKALGKKQFDSIISIPLGRSLGWSGQNDLTDAVFKYGAKDKKNFIVFNIRLIGLTQKWGGSHDQMFDFARHYSSGSAAGDLHGLIAGAHIERWFWSDAFADEPEIAQSYFKEQSVIDELCLHYEDLKQTRTEDVFSYLAVNRFAVCFYLSNQKAQLHDALSFLGGNVTKMPWCWTDEGTLGGLRAAHKIVGKTSPY